MKTKSMVFKAQELTPNELEIIEGGVNEMMYFLFFMGIK